MAVPPTCFSSPFLVNEQKHQGSCFLQTFVQDILVNRKKCQHFHKNVLQKLVPVAACTSSDWVEDAEEDCLPGLKVQQETEYGPVGKRQVISEVDLNHWLEQETGLDRVRIMFSTGTDKSFLQEDTRSMNTIFRRTVMLGAAVNIFMAATKNEGKKEKHLSQTQAMIKGVMNERKAVKGMWREAIKNTLRLTVFSFSFIYISQAIAAYRNRSSVWEYVISSTLAFGFCGLGQGARRLATLSLFGALAGGVGGVAVCSILRSQGTSQEQRHIERIRQYLQQQKLKEQKQLSTSSS